MTDVTTHLPPPPNRAGMLFGASILGMPACAAGSRLADHGLLEEASASRPRHLERDDPVAPGHSTARSLLRFAGTWAGNDLDRCLAEVHDARGYVEL